MSGIGRTAFVSKAILVKGILNSLLGALHIVGTFTFEASKVSGLESGDLRRDYLVWFYGVGLFIVFMGLIDVLVYKGLKAGIYTAWQVALLCAVFTTILGLSGVIAFGASPPLQLLITGAIGLVLLAVSRREFLAR